MNFPEGQFCGTYPHKMIARLEKEIEDLKKELDKFKKYVPKESVGNCHAPPWRECTNPKCDCWRF